MRLVPLLLLVSLVSVGAAPSPGCQASLPQVPHPGRHHRFNVTVTDPVLGEVTRAYVLHLPAMYSTSNTQPTPLMMDYHGWGGTAHDQMVNMPWRDLADTDSVPFLLVTMDGMNDVDHGHWSSWNVSASEGQLGITCDPSLHSDYACYASCAALTGDCSYNENACTFTSCYDDIVYTETVLYDILDRWCVDTDRVHMSGASNGGMFIWSRVMERLAGSLASVGPVCSAPLRGFNPMPDTPVSIIDFHGLNDHTIPFSPELPTNLGAGPDNTVIANDGWYYHVKMDHIAQITEHMNCDPVAREYPTHMDGSHGWVCQLWADCDGGKEVVQCNANYGHDYPFHNRYIEGVKILWDFMKVHPK